MVVVKIVQLKLQDTHISDLPITFTFNFSFKGVWINTSSDISNKMHMQNEPVYKYAQENFEKSFVSFVQHLGPYSHLQIHV